MPGWALCSLLLDACALTPLPPVAPAAPSSALAPREDSPLAATEGALRSAHGAEASGFTLLRNNLDALRWRLLAARIDFELTDDDRNNHRGEAKRRSEQFFRVEASVGME
jgi:hypothetical protein